MLKKRKLYFAVLFLLFAVGVPHYAKAGNAKIVNIRCGQTTTIKLTNKKEKIKWSCTSGRIKIVKKMGKHNNKIKIKGIKEGTDVLKATFNKKVIKFRIKVTKEENNMNAPKCSVVLKYVDVQENHMKVCVSITDISGTGIAMGANADFYQWDTSSASWMSLENTAIVPAVMNGTPKGTEMVQEYLFIPSEGNHIGGRYKIVLGDIYALEGGEIILKQPEIEFSV